MGGVVAHAVCAVSLVVSFLLCVVVKGKRPMSSWR